MKLSGLRGPVALTSALVAAGLLSAPALSDPVAGALPDRLHLSVPPLYLVFAPVFTMWDGISMLSMSRLQGFLIGLAVFYLLWRVARAFQRRHAATPWWRWFFRELATLTLSVGLLLGFLVLGALWHRPMISLAGTSAGEAVVDFHSHTSISHDVSGTLMEGFDRDANRRWHERAGFDAAFITDHNVVSRQVATPQSGTVLCPGIEISAWRAHIVMLGDTLPVDRRRYNESLAGLLDLLASSERAYGSLTVASLPEYRRNHWNRLDTLVEAGLDGFEIVNASPKANELTRQQRDSVISLARRHNRFLVGVSDSHGWGATSMVWNLVPVPANRDGPGVCDAVMQRLRLGFPAVRVIERHRLRPDSWYPMWLTPAGMVWETWRSMGWPLTVAWILWIWILWAVKRLARRDIR